jgi:hypothetical protein
VYGSDAQMSHPFLTIFAARDSAELVTTDADGWRLL